MKNIKHKENSTATRAFFIQLLTRLYSATRVLFISLRVLYLIACLNVCESRFL